jgi:hypothetical protein
VYGLDKNVNFAKLLRASERKPRSPTTHGRVLLAAHLPSTARRTGIAEPVELFDQLGVYLKIDSSLLERARRQYSHAAEHHDADRPVLAFGLATVRATREQGAPKARIQARVKQLALVPVGETLTPTPSALYRSAPASSRCVA